MTHRHHRSIITIIISSTPIPTPSCHRHNVRQHRWVSSGREEREPASDRSTKHAKEATIRVGRECYLIASSQATEERTQGGYFCSTARAGARALARRHGYHQWSCYSKRQAHPSRGDGAAGTSVEEAHRAGMQERWDHYLGMLNTYANLSTDPLTLTSAV